MCSRPLHKYPGSTICVLLDKEGLILASGLAKLAESGEGRNESAFALENQAKTKVRKELRCSYWRRLLTSCITGSVIRMRSAVYGGSQNLNSGFD